MCNSNLNTFYSCDDPKLPQVKAGEIIFEIQHKYNKTEHRYNIAKEIHRVITL